MSLDECIITRKIEIDMGHRVPMHSSKCRNPHGHRYTIEATVKGPILPIRGESDDGMVIDFGDIKDKMMTYIHDPYDHAFIFAFNDKECQEMFYQRGFKAFAVDFIPTAENLAKHWYEVLNPTLSDGLELMRVRVYETPNSKADYPPVVLG